jgi:hypothetical protein
MPARGMWTSALHPRGAGGRFATGRNPKFGWGRAGRTRRAYRLDATEARADQLLADHRAAQAALEHAQRWNVRVGEHRKRAHVAKLRAESAVDVFRRLRYR